LSWRNRALQHSRYLGFAMFFTGKTKTKVNNVTLCTIAADCEDCLPRFFAWCLPIFKNIVIVTSESEDTTLRIIQKVASENPHIIVKHRELDDFARQKQFCADLAPTEWKIIIDADEILEDIDLDACIKKLTAATADVMAFPRFNLQSDEYHYLKAGYPDFQERLFNSRVTYNLDAPIHEQLEGARKKGTSNKHIIHWGHVRSEQQLLRKSDVRKKFAGCDAIDGQGLLAYPNWFHARNRYFNGQTESLPKKIIKRIKEYENCTCHGL
jgi:glycosyltransferase involved in cell wall biosynthesis